VLTVFAMCVAYPVWQLERVTAASQYDVARVEALLAARSALQISILTARAGLVLSFDDLNRALAEMRAVGVEASYARALGHDYTQAADELAAAADAQRAEESGIETFKTDMALLRLSSRQFPAAVDAMERGAFGPGRELVTAGQQEERDSRTDRSDLGKRIETARAAISGLRYEVERYEAAPTRQVARRLEAAILTLSELRASWGDDDASSRALAVLLGHTRVILDRRERVDGFARNFARSPVRSHLEATRAAYDRAARGPLGATALLRLVASLLAVLGVLAFGVAAWRATRLRRRSD
jgi:hypothetical protein